MFASPQLRELAPAAALGLRRPLRSPYASMAIAYFGYIAVAILIAALLQPEQEDVTRDLGFGEGSLGSTAAALLIVVAAPISEEMFFRGFMFAGLRRSVPFVVAALISSCVWGLFHYTGPGLVGSRPAARRSSASRWPGSTSAPDRSGRRSPCTPSTTQSPLHC